ncbi:MAG: DUF3298 domain-containing protein [Patescibacteria group bacterium]
MEKKHKTILTLLVLFLLGSAIYFLTYGGNRKEQTPITATSTATTTVTTFEIKTEYFSDSSSEYDALVEYPQFVGAKSGTVEERMNAQFKKESKAVYEQTATELADAASAIAGRDIIFQRKLQSDKTYINNETSVMSLVYSQYIDTGGAHGTFLYVSQSVDLKTGKKLMLSDLFKGDYESVLRKEIDKQIRSAATTCLRCDSLADELSNLNVQLPDHFLLSDQGITFLFGAYELGSYAATASGQEVFVHKDLLNEYILRAW